MTQENKELVLKDLSARLPHGIKCHIKGDDMNTSRKLSRIEVDELDGILLDFWTDREYYLSVYLSEVKPYLRPMSSMTEEEKKEYHNLCYAEERECYEFGEWTTRIYFHDTIESIDWLNENHFDYRGLIEKRLAIVVMEENNPYKE